MIRMPGEDDVIAVFRERSWQKLGRIPRAIRRNPWRHFPGDPTGHAQTRLAEFMATTAPRK